MLEKYDSQFCSELRVDGQVPRQCVVKVSRVSAHSEDLSMRSARKTLASALDPRIGGFLKVRRRPSWALASAGEEEEGQ